VCEPTVQSTWIVSRTLTTTWLDQGNRVVQCSVLRTCVYCSGWGLAFNVNYKKKKSQGTLRFQTRNGQNSNQHLLIFIFKKSICCCCFSSSFYPPKLNSEYYWQGSDRFLYVSTILWLTNRDCRIFIVRAWCSECVHTLDLGLSFRLFIVYCLDIYSHTIQKPQLLSSNHLAVFALVHPNPCFYWVTCKQCSSLYITDAPSDGAWFSLSVDCCDACMERFDCFVYQFLFCLLILIIFRLTNTHIINFFFWRQIKIDVLYYIVLYCTLTKDGLWEQN
jgi:hypothetical protein